MRKKIDNRIRVLIENGVIQMHRSMFVVVGDKAKEQVVILHHMLSKASVKARPSVLWCYKKELGFSSHKKKKKGKYFSTSEDDPFKLFVAATQIRFCYYSETHKILGSTYGMCVLQDFEALTPNLLARTIETVEGGGLVVLLLRSIASLKQLYTMTMDVHSRFRTESHQDVVCRFNERFILSLASCANCMLIDDQLRLMPTSSAALSVKPLPADHSSSSNSSSSEHSAAELSKLKDALRETQPVGALVACCKTLDQGKAVLKFIDAISEKTLRTTVTMTAARGRGKSAALGLAMASALAFGYSNIFVTAPSPENLATMFQFVFKGFDALEYQEHLDYEIVQSTNAEFNRAIVRVNVFREHRQTIQYIHPADAHKLGQAELVCIDEAAAIPLPLVKKLFGPYLVFMSSTINGYEGTGRSLSLKLIQQLRTQNQAFGNTTTKTATGEVSKSTTGFVCGRVLHEITLEESIRYHNGDLIESWLSSLLCLDATIVKPISSGCPVPASCDLYYVNRDTLFSYHSASEAFLQRLMSLYVSSHYKNTPNDLQMLADAPAHHIFCLLGPVDPTTSKLPEVLCVLQVCLEGEISRQTIMNSLSRGKRASGDLIPWTISQQFQDNEFGEMSGGRIVRIASHPDYQSMGYGSRAVSILQSYYQGDIQNLSDVDEADEITAAANVDEEEVDLLEERLAPRKGLPPLLSKLCDRPPEKLDYLGVSFGLTQPLFTFWKRSGFVPVYLRQTTNDLTGEHSTIMLKILNHDPTLLEVTGEVGQGLVGSNLKKTDWLISYWQDFRRRFVSLLSYEFRSFASSLALSLLNYDSKTKDMTRIELEAYFTPYDLQRLDLYSRNMVDYHLIMDLMPLVARLCFLGRFDVNFSLVQSAILLAIGLQHKTVDEFAKEMDLPASQVLSLFNRIIKKIIQCLVKVQVKDIESSMVIKEVNMNDTGISSLKDELSEMEKEYALKRAADTMKGLDLQEYSIKGNEQDWSSVNIGKDGIVSVKGKGKNDGRKEGVKEELDKIIESGPPKYAKGKGKPKKKKSKH